MDCGADGVLVAALAGGEKAVSDQFVHLALTKLDRDAPTSPLAPVAMTAHAQRTRRRRRRASVTLLAVAHSPRRLHRLDL
jgi:hypothetical protein